MSENCVRLQTIKEKKKNMGIRMCNILVEDYENERKRERGSR